MNGHHRGGDQADHVLGQWPDHFLTPLASNQLGLALLVSHCLSLPKQPRSDQEGRQGYPQNILRLALVGERIHERHAAAAGAGLVLDRERGGGDQADQDATGQTRRLVAIDRSAGNDL